MRPRPTHSARPGRRLAILAPLVAALAAMPTAGRAATLTVTVAAVDAARGHVRIGVCTRTEFLSERCAYHAVVPARAGSVQAVIPGIRPGTYAVAAYHDATDAGHLRRGLFGIPRDGIGFSRDPPIRFGPPSFDRSALGIGAADAAITITLRYGGG